MLPTFIETQKVLYYLKAKKPEKYKKNKEICQKLMSKKTKMDFKANFMASIYPTPDNGGRSANRMCEPQKEKNEESNPHPA